jgi:hypothetical protein
MWAYSHSSRPWSPYSVQDSCRFGAPSTAFRYTDFSRLKKRDERSPRQRRTGTACAYLALGSTKCQPFEVGPRPSVAAIFTRAGRESAFIFRITLPRCTFTVISVMKSSLPICLFTRPRTTNAIT